jgi:hypothetical protein
MENQFNNTFTNDLTPEPARPQFLKILCILTFVWSGILIILYLIGSMVLFIGEETSATIAEKIMETNPMIQIEDSSQFFHEIGIVCLLSLIANIGSLVGAIMMWNLNRIGLIIYAIAELSTNFFGLSINTGTEEKSYGMMIVTIIIDVAFIVMYAVHLKYMNKNRTVAIS